MSRKMISEVMLALLLISILAFTSNVQLVRSGPRTWIVDDDGPADFHTIQEAINAADDGDTIQVRNGTYYENVVANKSVTLDGECMEATIVDGQGFGTTIFVSSAYTVICNFTIQNSGDVTVDAGVRLANSNCTLVDNFLRKNRHAILVGGFAFAIVSKNHISHNKYGVTLERTNNNTIAQNVVTDNEYNGVSLWYSSGTKIRRNVFEYCNSSGVYMFGSDGNVIEDNIITNNKYDGIHHLDSNANSLTNNTIESNGSYGILLVNSTRVTISCNKVVNNSAGIRLRDAIDNVLKRNTVSFSEWDGFSLGSSENNTISENTVEDNRNGVYLSQSFSNNFHHNNFINNTVQASSCRISTNIWDNGCEGNYWSDYVEKYPDATNNSLGIWDTPYEINENNTDRFPLLNVYWNPGDINHDLKVDMKDVGIAAKAFGSYPDFPNWNCHADIAGPENPRGSGFYPSDGKVDMRDVALAAKNFGKIHPSLLP